MKYQMTRAKKQGGGGRSHYLSARPFVSDIRKETRKWMGSNNARPRIPPQIRRVGGVLMAKSAIILINTGGSSERRTY